jgi:hypothetical protein
MDRPDLNRRIEEYAKRRGLVLGESLGAGVHGNVFSAENQITRGRIALKGHERERDYRQERDVYLRLRDCGVTTIRGCEVPILLDFDDALWVIEITVVNRPFVLDFVGVELDHDPPDFSDEVMADWEAEGVERFGSDWLEVKAILGSLQAYGIFTMDVNPGNISFRA